MITEKTEIINKPKEVKRYICSDGKEFTNKSQAEIYEKLIGLMNEASRLHAQYTPDTAFDEYHTMLLAGYCKTKEDLKLLCDIYAYDNPYHSFTKHEYLPTHRYTSDDFKGADWYFLQVRYNNDYADDYWIDTLSDLKSQWNDFVNQFEVS